MKWKLLIAVSMLILSYQLAEAQVNLNKVVKNVKNKAGKNIENRIEQKMDSTVDKTLDNVETGIDGSMKSDTESTKKTTEGNAQKSTTTKKTDVETKPQQKDSLASPIMVWSKYDFVPGNEIVFEDTQDNEQNGEFPSKWDLAGGSVENANFDGFNVIMFRKSNINGVDGIVPLLKDCKEDYLPDEFTIEFDAYFPSSNDTYRIYLLDTKSQKNIDPTNNISKRQYLRFKQNSADGQGISTSYYPGFSSGSTKSSPSWRHIAISFNKRALKAYIDDARVLNIPNIGYNPLGLNIAFHNPSGGKLGFVKNIRIAKGAVPLYDKFLTDGKYVTTGIKFDVNKATLRPESMGTINYIVKMMQEHPDLKFSVEGHTDSDGHDANNLSLSESRAKEVVSRLVEAGISPGRLFSKGYGESRPIANNETSEGKAQNRRVEFVKM